ncbi:putative secreted protein [Propionispora sp. 2/2-37]|uniref:hypothetical protein n=1 Tax=Propionispora sp. 2/2-37 TaxID=1677858 RepID=UPI0006BB6F36|nr:hypothetical protein [Propionispora sp. 2/2-37]CUH95019.1 putative secreted protein [Propionispora sp. 2/2-37]
MNNTIKGWMIGSLVAVSALGMTFGSAAAQSTELAAPSPGVMQNGHMTNMGPDMMKNSPDMQKQCEVMLKEHDSKREGAAAGTAEMNSPEMQRQCRAMMKETEEAITDKAPANDSTASGTADHNSHHLS